MTHLLLSAAPANPVVGTSESRSAKVPPGSNLSAK
jgi:hypothetical protein